MDQHLGFHQDLAPATLQQAKLGDLHSLEKVYKAYARACYALAYRICRDRALSEDVIQNAFIRVIHNISGLKEDSRFAPWLKTIVSNEAINVLKKQRLVDLSEPIDRHAIGDSSLFDHQWLTARDDVEKLLHRLPVTARTVLVLHEIEGFNHAEIGKLFEKSESFSKVTLSRAYAKLKQMVSQQERNYALK